MRNIEDTEYIKKYEGELNFNVIYRISIEFQ